MKITNENTNRRIDTLGRISLPKPMRDKLGIESGQELSFFLIEDDNGIPYIACTKRENVKIEKMSKKEIAAQVLRDLGYDVPDELL